jgi:hypothetical protein
VWSLRSTRGILLIKFVSRVRGDRLWILYVQKRRYSDGLVERKYGGFVSVNLDPSLPQRKLYQNLRGLGIVNASERPQVEMDVERLNNYFLTRPLLNGAGAFTVSRTNNVPEFSFATVSKSEICDAGMSIRSAATGVDGIPLSFIKLLLHIFDQIFVSSEFPSKWKTSVVLPIPKVSSPAKLSDYRPISLLVCLSKVFEVLMAQQMERHIRCNNLLTVFQSGFRRLIYSTSHAADRV